MDHIQLWSKSTYLTLINPFLKGVLYVCVCVNIPGILSPYSVYNLIHSYSIRYSRSLLRVALYSSLLVPATTPRPHQIKSLHKSIKGRLKSTKAECRNLVLVPMPVSLMLEPWSIEARLKLGIGVLGPISIYPSLTSMYPSLTSMYFGASVGNPAHVTGVPSLALMETGPSFEDQSQA